MSFKVLPFKGESAHPWTVLRCLESVSFRQISDTAPKTETDKGDDIDIGYDRIRMRMYGWIL